MEEILLDSAVKFERLKPIFYNLQTAYEFRGKEVEQLREALRLSDLQNAVQKQEYERIIADLRRHPRRQWWKGFKAGLGTGVILGGAAGSAI